ncbi:PAS domain-containing protein [Streptomyces sp. VRA16 Mangrove soil]|uniref:PAS domain-containing protein n=1 Tax=Streptomyces sp. VRA16 Mangrove soil TaxID=2817434 RepID=UPI001A9F2AEA|nr:PAS domain-containing protein [Streptomyces sp. VRA16 Mangrove soil]MBO1330585.1 PAS domain-containing protein [Streptomyces sp. VRA16 Mangrove soil]
MDAVVWRNRAMVLFDRIPLPVAVCDPYGTVRLANAALAAVWDTTPGRLKGRDMLDLFPPLDAAQVDRIAQALKLRRRSRYSVNVTWRDPHGRRRQGELIVDPVSDTATGLPDLLVMLRTTGEPEPREDSVPEPLHPNEERILALLAAGATTARAARETGLTSDGVTYHLRRLSQRWGAANRTELVARAYATGVLVPGVWPPQLRSSVPGIGAPEGNSART